MGRKRKAETEEEERTFSQDVKMVRDPKLRQTEITTIGDSGIHVRTLTSVDHRRAAMDSHITSPSVGDSTPQEPVSEESENPKKTTQVTAQRARRQALLMSIY